MNFDTKQATGLPKTDTPWTNNNSESENHVLKQEIQWATQNLSDLIDSLYNVVKLQYQDLKRALIPGLGNFELTEQTRKLATNPTAWENKTPAQKQSHFNRLLTTPIVTKPNVSISSDGLVATLVPSNGGKKAHQVKRKRTARTNNSEKTTTLTSG
jgi:nucleoid DNA-binding protein